METVRHFNFSETALPMAGAAGGGCAVPESRCRNSMSALTTPVSSGGVVEVSAIQIYPRYNLVY